MRTSPQALLLLAGCVGRPGYERCFDPSNFAAINRRYPARIVSGLETQATCARALRPSLLPISASVSRSGSDSRSREGRCDRRIRFSAARPQRSPEIRPTRSRENRNKVHEVWTNPDGIHPTIVNGISQASQAGSKAIQSGVRVGLSYGSRSHLCRDPQAPICCRAVLLARQSELQTRQVWPASDCIRCGIHTPQLYFTLRSRLQMSRNDSDIGMDTRPQRSTPTPFRTRITKSRGDLGCVGR